MTTVGITTNKSEDKADILNRQFYSVFTDKNLLSVPSPTSSFPIMPNISLNVKGIYKLLNILDVDKAPGPDMCNRDSSDITSNIYSITHIRELTRRLAYY